jgi:penicillin amidase
MRKFARRALLLLLVLVLLAAGGISLALRSSLPQTEGRLALPGLGAEVRVTRDARGIPTIRAASDRDAALALGFVHAQDRLFQMDLMRRLVAGRLSEWLGSRALMSDRYFRTTGLYRAAQQQYALLSPELRGVLDAYAAGVNAYLATRRGALPADYYVVDAASLPWIDATPEPWQPADTLAWGKLMAQFLGGSFRRELLHARLAKLLKPEDLAILYPPYPKDGPIAVDEAALWLKGLPLDWIYGQIPEASSFASDNWVVDGKHSLSGKPILANDPHLGFSAPSIWYLARIETPELALAGVTAPGAPFVVIGHNQRIAWGFTNTESDVADLFIERLDPADKTRYLVPGGSAPFTMRREQVLVRGADPVMLDLRETRHGPVISDLGGAYGEVAGSAGGDSVLALEATFLDGEDRSPEAFRALNRALNWDAFRAALKDYVAPQQNMVYADIDGNIGFLAPGRVPIRGKGDGWLPSPGWSGEYDWVGYIPFDQLPTAFNPASGRVVSANNKIVPESYPYFLGRDWDLPNRALRINELLDQTPKQSPDASAAMQADTLSLLAKDLLPLMLAIEPGDKATAEALDRLKAWDARMDRDEAAPLLFTAWLRTFDRAVFAAKLGDNDALIDYWDASPHPDVVRSILTRHIEWCAAPPLKTCADQLKASLKQARAELTDRYGADMAGWSWGRAHDARFANQLWSNIPILRSLVATTIPANGGYDTLDRGVSIFGARDPYADLHGPTLRMIVDLADIDSTRFMIAPGQSGNVASHHYSDLMVPWRDHAYVRLDGDAAGGTLLLAPP